MKSTQFRLDELARHVNGQVIGHSDLSISALASLAAADAQSISFVSHEKHLADAQQSHAAALIVTEQLRLRLPQQQNFIVVENPYLAFALLSHVFEHKVLARGIEATAQIAESAIIAEDAYIGHYVVIGEHCVIGSNTIIQAHSTISDGTEIGRDCFIAHHVAFDCAVKVGDRVRIHSNTVIGGEGFGFAPYQAKWHRIAQLGSVRIGHDVRIGSNCSIDRGALDDTILENGVIIDNLVQIAHNVVIGENTAIAAKCGIAGSTKIGKNCILAGGVGVVGHIEIADNVQLTGMSMITKNILQAGTYSSGTSFLETGQWKRAAIRFKQLADVPLTKIVKQLDHMQAQIESLETILKLRK
ncbi:UDP-3-O-(3-hydroxymyristoyl)glucosamine N-acyltransferase [Acinetobacter larvae]|uniref:UDP-3-O-acylglucosamine N-acyltransferase n=1 Tax=Acinetobacter larvae TaxID=1789224 RepID=A0A1B2M0F6_9GAMM|nr:UDP-3-O-(3-hydroxymyristoyl)glucosamine N-acyltransferase [Acinetobacter larvae]AOA58649.1 UDP-3-O-(3-hydroxymyristoyl)glucosamine N-acyltransferase [Acinetobacter larvae]